MRAWDKDLSVGVWKVIPESRRGNWKRETGTEAKPGYGVL